MLQLRTISLKMPYLIDGHNLIPHMRGLSLQQIDDEQALIERLQGYFQHLRRKAVIYFDRAQPGNHVQTHGAFLNVHYVPLPSDADSAILHHLKKLGAEARNWFVVSSDLAVQRGARQAGARVISSSAFASRVEKGNTGRAPAQLDTSQDVSYWLDVFGKKS